MVCLICMHKAHSEVNFSTARKYTIYHIYVFSTSKNALSATAIGAFVTKL